MNRTGKIFVILIEGKWDWSDLFAAIDKAVTLLDSVDYGVNIVVDIRNSQHIPPLSPASLRKVAEAPTMSHANTQLLIVIGAKFYIQTMFDVFKRIYPRAGEKYHFIRTIDELPHLLAQRK